MKYVLILFFTLLLIACGGSLPPPPPPGQVEVTCADVYNDGDTADCPNRQTAFFELIPTANAATLIDAGTISRGTLINATQDVTNNTGADITGWVEMKFDAGCNGAVEWIIMPKQAFTFPNGQTFTLTIGGSCGDMPLGARTLTATAWQPDGTTEIGQVIVSFSLIE